MTSVQTPTRTSVEVDGFVEALRAQSRRYHDQHPFHVRMNAGRLTRRQLQGWVANRFYYQTSIPRKDAAILADCPDVEVRRRWIRRIVDVRAVGEDRGVLARDGGLVVEAVGHPPLQLVAAEPARVHAEVERVLVVVGLRPRAQRFDELVGQY